MIYRALIVFSFFISTFAIDQSWQAQKTEVNHKIWTSKKKILVFKRQLKSDTFNFEKYKFKTIKHKAKMLNFIGASDWQIKEKAQSNKKLVIRGQYTDTQGKTIYFLEGHYKRDKELKHFLLTGPDKLKNLKIELAKIEELLNDYL